MQMGDFHWNLKDFQRNFKWNCINVTRYINQNPINRYESLPPIPACCILFGNHCSGNAPMQKSLLTIFLSFQTFFAKTCINVTRFINQNRGVVYALGRALLYTVDCTAGVDRVLGTI